MDFNSPGIAAIMVLALLSLFVLLNSLSRGPLSYEASMALICQRLSKDTALKGRVIHRLGLTSDELVVRDVKELFEVDGLSVSIEPRPAGARL